MIQIVFHSYVMVTIVSVTVEITDNFEDCHTGLKAIWSVFFNIITYSSPYYIEICTVWVLKYKMLHLILLYISCCRYETETWCFVLKFQIYTACTSSYCGVYKNLVGEALNHSCKYSVYSSVSATAIRYLQNFRGSIILSTCMTIQMELTLKKICINSISLRSITWNFNLLSSVCSKHYLKFCLLKLYKVIISHIFLASFSAWLTLYSVQVSVCSYINFETYYIPMHLFAL